jgi:trk system potassium uptake protein TrkH
MQSGRTFWDKIAELPLFLLICGVFALSMYVPAVVARVADQDHIARTFFYAGTLGLIVVILISIAVNGRRFNDSALTPLVSLFACFAVLPFGLAVPFFEGVQTTSFMNAYFEMTSAITTTGATIFDDPERLASSLHLWRAQVGWLGGLIMWIAASAILAPLNLGGFEITTQAEPGQLDSRLSQIVRADPRKRLFRTVMVMLPIYSVLTISLWVLLFIAGDTPLVALCHAMAIMATSGISPVGGLAEAGSSWIGEAMMLFFLVFAVSRLTFANDIASDTGRVLRRDPEFKIGLIIAVMVPLVLFSRHWIGAWDFEQSDSLIGGLEAYWGTLFTVMSFLTTTGFESTSWDEAQAWSGLGTPGMVLMGLALIGGGVATTAGGVKLLRVFALYQNGRREMERLVHPSSVSGSKELGGRVHRQGAFSAWIFFMMFAVTLAFITVLLAFMGVSFEDAIVLGVSMLTTTGPLTQVAGEVPIVLAELSGATKVVLCAAMVVGRLETLAIIAMISPELWRN